MLAQLPQQLTRRRQACDFCRRGRSNVSVAASHFGQALARTATTSLLCLSLTAPYWSPPLSVAFANDSQVVSSVVQQQQWNDEALTGGKERTFRVPSEEEKQRKRELFTDSSYAALLAIESYAAYVESLRPVEQAPGCEACASNRLKLERAWQTVANEVVDEPGVFTQAAWGPQLEAALRRAGGALHTLPETEAALSSMLATVGDEYSAYLTPSAFRSALRRPLPAELAYASALAVGVGLQLEASTTQGWAVAPLASTPAEEAGISRGDVLRTVDDTPVATLSRDAVDALLRGPSGSLVNVDINTPNGPRTVVLERRALPQPPVSMRLLKVGNDSGPVALIRVRYHSSEGTRALGSALATARAAGAEGVVLDLRNNPGGILEEAIASSAFFVECGTTVGHTQRGGPRPETTFKSCSLPGGQFENYKQIIPRKVPVAVLVNASTASAAEALAASLHDTGRARLIGMRSFGKSQVQFFFNLGDDVGGLKLTVKRWLTPRLVDVAAAPRGLAPDTSCAAQPARLDDTPDACVRAALDYVRRQVVV